MRTSLSIGLPILTARSRSTSGGALLPSLLRHVGGDVGQELLEGVGAEVGIRAEHRRVDRVRLDVDAHVARDQVLVAADQRASGGAAGERHRVHRAEQVEQAADRAGQELERPLRQQLRLDDDLRDAVGEHGAGGASLGDHGYAGEHGAGQLLTHAPGREVERVDVHGHAGARRPHVLAVEARRARQLQPVAIRQVEAGRQRSPEAGVVGQRARRTVEVELGVAAGVAPVLAGDVDQFVAVFVQRRRQVLQQLGALRKRQRPQRWSTDLARVLEHCGEVDTTGAHVAEHGFGRGIVKGLGVAAAGDPTTTNVALQRDHRGEDLTDRAPAMHGRRAVTATATAAWCRRRSSAGRADRRQGTSTTS
jgi:hypothetical protein